MIYDVFISYSRRDYVDEQKNVIPGNEVSKIKDALSKAGITYWFDEEGIYSGQNFVEKIVTNIENARIFLFLSTANANKSPWTCKEIASADEFKKHIIPVRIDSSPYNKKVLFRIADLDYIEYYSNPQKGITDLIKSIKTHLEEQVEEMRKKQEEENKRKELERKKEEELRRQKELAKKRLQEEQERLVSEIKLSCATLNNEETKLELDRENLILKAEAITDGSLCNDLINLIKTGGAIHQKYQKGNAALAEEVEKLKSANSELQNKNETIHREYQKENAALAKEVERLKSANSELQNKNKQIPQLSSRLQESEFFIADLQNTVSNLNKHITNNNEKVAKNRMIMVIIIFVCVFLYMLVIFFVPRTCSSTSPVLPIEDSIAVDSTCCCLDTIELIDTISCDYIECDSVVYNNYDLYHDQSED